MAMIILFEDNPDAAPDLRQQHMAAHLAFLEANGGEISSAGPLFTPDGAGAGGIWVLLGDDTSRADALVKADPFWPTGLRKSYRILRWTQVFRDGTRQI